ncbi:hypothetical protein JW309_12210 [Enterobacter bugandensis]|uniref:DUF6414 family protein n=1 Tax=Enterobacter bugandensis TaxID=881260 RepID=UPI001C5B3AF4|nr:hypothetical protein [Enterobacter bugandensis]MBW4193054.1 hypothetical protein [Enterobacter bugandensis]
MVQDSQNIDSLFDFLYVDRERVGSLTAQLFPSGVLSTIKQTSSTSESDQKELKGGIPLISAKTNAGEAWARSQERLFDSSWSLPLNLIDKLDELSLIQDNVSKSHLGQIIIATGKIKLFDVKMVHDIMPIFKKIKQDELKSAKNVTQKQTIKEEINNADNAIGMLSLLPFSTQIEFSDEQGNLFWMSVKPDDLTIDSGNLTLKYGPRIPGDWHVVGFIDAHPEEEITAPELSDGFPTNELKEGMDGMLHTIRELMGRSPQSYGLTPLLIFRKVS